VIECDTTELDDLTALFARRAENMVPDAGREAMARANEFQASKQPHPGIKHARTIRHRILSPIASANLIARFMESVMFKKLLDFFGDW